MQTRMSGLRLSTATAEVQSSKWPQRCLRCIEAMPLGSYIRRYAAGWCHAACSLAPLQPSNALSELSACAG